MSQLRLASNHGVPLLNIDGSNSTQWKRAFSNYAISQYGSIATFLKTGAYVVRDVESRAETAERLGLESNTTNKPIIDKAWADDVSAMGKLQRQDAQDKIKIFGDLSRTLTVDGEEAMEEHEDWTAVNTDSDPLRKLQLIIKVHNLQLYSSLDREEALYRAVQKYNLIQQASGDSLSSFKDIFETMIQNIKSLDSDSAPSAKKAAKHFIETMHPTAHGEFRSYMKNAIAAGSKQSFESITAVVAARKAFTGTGVSSSSGTVSNSLPGAYTTETDTPCPFCDRPGHDESNCYSKQRAIKKAKEETKSRSQKKAPKDKAPPNKAPKGDHNKNSNKKGGKNHKGKTNKGKGYSAEVDSDEDDHKKFTQQDLTTAMFGLGYMFQIEDHQHQVRDATIGRPQLESPCCDVNYDYDMPTEPEVPAENQLILDLSLSYSLDFSTDDPRCVSYDTMANHSFAFNPDLVDNIQDANFKLKGVNGKATGCQKGVLPGFGPVAITPNSGRNGLAGHEAESRYHVVYRQNQYIDVKITSDFTVRFSKDPKSQFYTTLFTDEVLAQLRLVDQYIGSNDSYVTTVAQRASDFSKRDVARATSARQVTRRLVYPSDQALSNTFNKGSIIQCDVTGRDIALASKIFGPTVESLKGKSKDHGPTRETVYDVPRSQIKQQLMSCDVFVWRKVFFILAVLTPLQLIMARWIPHSARESDMIQTFEVLIGVVKSQGFAVTRVCTIRRVFCLEHLTHDTVSYLTVSPVKLP